MILMFSNYFRLIGGFFTGILGIIITPDAPENAFFSLFGQYNIIISWCVRILIAIGTLIFLKWQIRKIKIDYELKKIELKNKKNE